MQTPCWTWPGKLTPDGYVDLRISGFPRINLHVLIYRLCHGRLLKGFEVDHVCHNRACINPGHLEAVSHRENILRGDSPAAHHARKTHCVNNHEFTPENTRWRPGRTPGAAPARVCRSCAREWMRRSRRADAA